MNKKVEKFVSELKKLGATVYLRDGMVVVSAEEGDGLAEYDLHYIDPRLEKLAEKFKTFWEWETPGAIYVTEDMIA